jgi:hypothetical protein
MNMMYTVVDLVEVKLQRKSNPENTDGLVIHSAKVRESRTFRTSDPTSGNVSTLMHVSGKR